MLSFYQYIFVMVLLLCCSAFFSGSETAVMAVNRYRLQHKAKVKKIPAAERLVRMLAKPERLLGMILIGNTFMNMMLSSLMTWVTMTYIGEEWVFVSTLMLTIIVLVFAEIIPKTVAAHYADVLAYLVSSALDFLLWLSMPVVATIDFFTRKLLAVFSIKMEEHVLDKLTHDELRSLIRSKRLDAAHVTDEQFEDMLVGVLDLANMTVNDVMISRQEVFGLDLSRPWAEVVGAMSRSERMVVPVYVEALDQCLGMLTLSRIIPFMQDGKCNKQKLRQLLDPIRYVPEGTDLSSQLRHFQDHQYNFALIVDEYGDVCGVLSIEDIIEEIIGQFTHHDHITIGSLMPRRDGSYCLSGQLSIRDVNRLLRWQLPENGPNTLSGSIMEYLGCIPEGLFCVVMEGHRVEILQLRGSMIAQLKVYPVCASKKDDV